MENQNYEYLVKNMLDYDKVNERVNEMTESEMEAVGVLLDEKNKRDREDLRRRIRRKMYWDLFYFLAFLVLLILYPIIIQYFADWCLRTFYPLAGFLYFMMFQGFYWIFLRYLLEP